jgi:predicted O-methyltransferase YrrM
MGLSRRLEKRPAHTTVRTNAVTTIVESLTRSVAELRSKLERYELGWPPGHFYSPIPDLSQVREREGAIFRVPAELPGIDLRVDEQVRLACELARFYHEQPFQDHKTSRARYGFVNPNYSYGEALVLYGMLRYLRPRKVIEIGSGYSSCVTLDTNELFLGGSIECVFIEPDPSLLRSLLKAHDIDQVAIRSERLQAVDKRLFQGLHANDVLFVDSTHVSKVDSDVNHILFEILPSLESGVYIHFHDVMFPFEYPKELIYQGRAWNEVYILRAFLQFNGAFEIVFFNSYLDQFRKEAFESMPLALRNPGTSLWLRKR